METIEEKARAYDEAIKKAKSLYKASEPMSGCSVILEIIFPELAESEDEKVRKEILSFCQNRADNYSNDPKYVNIGKWIAWLEKQGEKLPAGFYYVNSEGKKFYSDTLKHGNVTLHVEKQDEQRSADTDNKFIRMRETKPKDISEFLDRLTTVEQEFLWEHIAKIRELDKEGQKSADKVEPKFHEGEWITNGDYTWKVVEVKPLDYTLLSQYDNIVVDTISHVDEQFHSFTIADAKDGDVLFMNNGVANCIFIYKSSNNGIINKYASYNKFGFEGEHYLVLNDGYVIPATKEQREQLEKAMADAGYTFDFEKKELKKIEPKTKENKGNVGGISANSEWSEEDEQHIDSLLKRLDALCRNKFERTRFAISEDRDWLKSLKSRVQPQKQWSKEDEVKINRIVACLENLNVADNDILLKDIDWLKSLRPQNTYNPYKAVVESIAEMCKHYDGVSHIGLRDFYVNVKVKCKDAKEYDKMFPQAQWKPSEEQIKVCKEVYADILSAKGFDLGTVNSELNRMEEQLKKLKKK